MNSMNRTISWRTILFILFILLLAIIFYNAIKTPVAKGTSVKSELKNSQVNFLYDLTYKKEDESHQEQEIFSKMKDMVQEAEEFIVIDMFLFNDDYDREMDFQNVSGEFTDTLIRQKEKNKGLEIVFITDEINTFYGSYPSKYLEKLKEHDIQVVITDLNQLRDSNPLYAGIWRTFFKHVDREGKGILPNPFSPDSPKVTLPSYLKIANMKANHRKVVITEKEALVTSLNVHDASSKHSNIAFTVDGDLANDLLETEKAVLKFSDEEPFDFKMRESSKGEGKAQVLTEGKIKEAVLEEIKASDDKDKIQLAMFYLADREVIKELLAASDRGVDIKTVLDPNKDAFGIKKNGIPNRPVASELTKKSDGKIQIKWYNTNGEQFHTKMIHFLREDESVIIAGSANLTRRNIEDYNLETNLKIVLAKDNPEAKNINRYFQRIWENEKGDYTLDYEDYEDHSLLKKVIYHIQESTGLSSF